MFGVFGVFGVLLLCCCVFVFVCLCLCFFSFSRRKNLRTESKRESSHTEHATRLPQSAMGALQKSLSTSDTAGASKLTCRPSNEQGRPGQRHKTEWSPIGATKAGASAQHFWNRPSLGLGEESEEGLRLLRETTFLSPLQ